MGCHFCSERGSSCLAAGGGALDDLAVLNVVGIVGLDVNGDTVEGALESVLGGGVHHAGLWECVSMSHSTQYIDCSSQKSCTHVLRRIVRDVADEGDLVALALAARSIVLDVVDGVTAANALGALAVLALGVDQLLAEGIVVGLGGGLLDDDLLVVIGKLVDDPLGALAELEVVELLDALGSDGDTVRRASIAGGSWLARHGNGEER